MAKISSPMSPIPTDWLHNVEGFDVILKCFDLRKCARYTWLYTKVAINIPTKYSFVDTSLFSTDWLTKDLWYY